MNDDPFGPHLPSIAGKAALVLVQRLDVSLYPCLFKMSLMFSIHLSLGLALALEPNLILLNMLLNSRLISLDLQTIAYTVSRCARRMI